MEIPDFIKQREILFSELHPDPNQAATAAALLDAVTGVSRTEARTPTLLLVCYDLRCVTLKQLEERLVAAGLHLSCKLINKLRRALCHYTEETQRVNCGCGEGDKDCTKKVFVSRFQRLDHSCRDQRPDHWRKYL